MILENELKAIYNDIRLNGGFREKNVLKNLNSIELGQNDLEHKVYTFYGTEEIGFKYDIRAKKIVG